MTLSTAGQGVKQLSDVLHAEQLTTNLGAVYSGLGDQARSLNHGLSTVTASDALQQVANGVGAVGTQATQLGMNMVRPLDIFGNWTLNILYIAVVTLISYTLLIAAPRQ
jgi:hypothetical protein